MTKYSFIFFTLIVFLCTTGSHSRIHGQQKRQLWDLITGKIVDIFSTENRAGKEHELLLFPDVAFESLSKNGTWTIRVHGWKYRNNRRKTWFQFSISQWIERIKQNLIHQSDKLRLDESITEDRLEQFFAFDESNKIIRIKIGNEVRSITTDTHGQFLDDIEIEYRHIDKFKQQELDGIILKYEAFGDDTETVVGTVRFIEPSYGVSIISDIDDTIKISEVLDKVHLLANTFVLPFKPVPGMSELYRQWQTNNQYCTFHYLSSMPGQMYTLTEEFIRANNFPDGSFHMRHFDWTISSLLNFLRSESTFNHKMNYLRFFLLNTRRLFVLVGDSGEKDPEIYGMITREFPERICAIFIRVLKRESRNHPRFAKAFLGIPSEKWLVFNDSRQVPTYLSTFPKKFL